MESLIGLIILLILFVFGGALFGFIAYSRVKKLEKTVNTLQRQVWSLLELDKSKAKEVKTKISPSEIHTPSLVKEIPVKKTEEAVIKEHPVKKTEEPVQKTDEAVKKTEHVIKKTGEITGEVFKTTDGVVRKTEEPLQNIEEKTEKLTGKSEQQKPVMKRFEANFMENWTGIIGAIITVIGIGFLGVFTALNLSEIYRFFMIVIISVVLLIVYFVLRPKDKWLKLSLWMRSMSAALFLLACAGAGGIPGLRWIENPLYGLVILCLGIGANILLAVLGKKEVIASVHLLLSLTALAIAPQNQVIFIIATVITFAGILLTLREKWELHLLLSTTLYCAYFLFYYFTMGTLEARMKITGIISISAVSIIALFVHYRKLYKHEGFDIKPFLTHILTWIYFGIGIYIYALRVYWISIPLGSAAILCFLFAHRARTLKIRWLFNTDILMAQVIAIIAVVTLIEWNIPYYPIISILFIETLVFTAIVLIEEEYILYNIGKFFFYFFAVLLIIFSFIHIADYDRAQFVPNTMLLSLCIFTALLYHIFAARIIRNRIETNRLHEPEKNWCHVHNILCGGIAGFFFIPLYFTLRHRLPFVPYVDAEYLLLIPLVIIIIAREKIQSTGLGISLLFTLLIIHFTMWLDPFFTSGAPWFEKLLYSMPLFILDSVCVWFAFVKSLDRQVKWPGIYLGAAHLLCVVYFIFNPISPLIPGVVWLLLSVVFLEFSRFASNLYHQTLTQKGSPDVHLLTMGYLYIGAFLVRHILVHLQSAQYIWIIKARLLIELFALVIFIYWALYKKPPIPQERKSFTHVHPLFPELITLFAVLTIAIELKSVYHPIAWILGSGTALFIGMTAKAHLSRFRFYSLLLYWASIIHVAFLTSPLVSPSLQFFDQTWFFSLIATVLQFGYIIFFYKKGDLVSTVFPVPVAWFRGMVKYIEPRKNLWIYYPLFISIALFLIWSFDTSILTLLLSAECFVIFVTSIILRENHFRYASLAGLGLCMIRLVVYDLASSNILTKAVVCIGVGLLLIGMNALYNKFSGRFTR